MALGQYCSRLHDFMGFLRTERPTPGPCKLRPLHPEQNIMAANPAMSMFTSTRYLKRDRSTNISNSGLSSPPASPALVARRLLVCAVGATKAVLQRAAAPDQHWVTLAGEQNRREHMTLLASIIPVTDLVGFVDFW